MARGCSFCGRKQNTCIQYRGSLSLIISRRDIASGTQRVTPQLLPSQRRSCPLCCCRWLSLPRLPAHIPSHYIICLVRNINKNVGLLKQETRHNLFHREGQHSGPTSGTRAPHPHIAGFFFSLDWCAGCGRRSQQHGVASTSRNGAGAHTRLHTHVCAQFCCAQHALVPVLSAAMLCDLQHVFFQCCLIHASHPLVHPVAAVW